MSPRPPLRHAVDACVYRVYACNTGRDLDHPFLAPILKSLPNDVEFKGEEGGVVVNLHDNGQDLSFSAVELVAMVLSSAQVIWMMHFGWTVPVRLSVMCGMDDKTWRCTSRWKRVNSL